MFLKPTIVCLRNCFCFVLVSSDTLFHDDFRLSRFLDEYLDLQTRWGDELGAFAEVYTCPEEGE